MGKLNHILPILICGCMPAGHGQNAPAPLPAKADKATFPAKPMRHVGGEVEDFVRATADTFAISTRTFDPFGLPLDPDYTPPAPPPSATPAAEEVPGVPFSEIIRRIQITTVMAGEKKFLVGARSFSVGDRFPVNFDGQAIWIEITEVSARQVGFRNVQTGETAAQPLNLLPPGMTPGGGSITAPGMVPANPQAPLDLNSSGSAPVPPPR